MALLFLALASGFGNSPGARADDSFDPMFPMYPPGCATVPDVQNELYGDNIAKVFEGRIALINARKTTENLDAIVAVYRVACAEANKSVIWLSFTIPPELHSTSLYRMPGIEIALSANGGGRSASLSREPGGAVATYSDGLVIGNREGNNYLIFAARSWIYLLDLDQGDAYWNGAISPDVLNGSFTLRLVGLSSSKVKSVDIPVPSTEEVLDPNSWMPLNGRLSGTWVADGAPDQGMMLAVSELVGDSIPEPDRISGTPMLLFLSWYTFDSEGRALWLTGSAQFLPGDSSVSLDLVRVSGGEFMATAAVDRRLAGNLTLRAVSCGQIDVDYDLSMIGLGAGHKSMNRLFGLEVSEFSCSGGTSLQGGGS